MYLCRRLQTATDWRRSIFATGWATKPSTAQVFAVNDPLKESQCTWKKMLKTAVLGTGLIGTSYALALNGNRSTDKVETVSSRSEESYSLVRHVDQGTGFPRPESLTDMDDSALILADFGGNLLGLGLRHCLGINAGVWTHFHVRRRRHCAGFLLQWDAHRLSRPDPEQKWARSVLGLCGWGTIQHGICTGLRGNLAAGGSGVVCQANHLCRSPCQTPE